MTGRPLLEVVEPGLLTTVQDDGRPEHVHLGVPVGGACDPRSLALANAVCGNEPSAAVLEMTLHGPTLRVMTDCVIGLAGADFEGRVDAHPRRLSTGRADRVRAGETLRFDTPREGTGIRGYLAIGGGIDVPVVLGSRSTCLAGRFGGLDGRALRAGDVIRGVSTPWSFAERSPEPHSPAPSGRLRIVAGPDLDRVAGGVLDRFVGTGWSVGARSDRQGMTLDGPPLAASADAAAMLSHGVVWGAVQLPPDGRPICLLADHGTVGGYPVIAVVIRADLPALGQLGPGDAVRFELVEVAKAQSLARSAADQLARTVATLGSRH